MFYLWHVQENKFRQNLHWLWQKYENEIEFVLVLQFVFSSHVLSVYLAMALGTRFYTIRYYNEADYIEVNKDTYIFRILTALSKPKLSIVSSMLLPIYLK